MKHASLFFCVLALLTSTALAGVTGKVVGFVTDDQGEPLPGVNVVVVGETRGAATDFNGEYAILGVAPGNYTLQFSSLGYSTLLVENINVSVDLSTHHDAVLVMSAIEGETVTIVAERAMVQVDQTFSASYVSAKDLAVMPVTELSQVVDIQAGVVDGHFRGGRGGEVLYLVDGIAVTDVYDGSKGVDVQVSMVQELQVISGTFNAEYGQAMSGVVNTVTRDAGDELQLTLSGYAGDYLSNHTDEFYAIDELDPLTLSNVELGFSSPTPLEWLSVNGSLRYTDNSGWYTGQRLFSPQEQVGSFQVDGTDYFVYNASQVNEFVIWDFLGEEWAFFADDFADSAYVANVDLINEIFNAQFQNPDSVTVTAADSALVYDLIATMDQRSEELYERASGDDGDIEDVPMNTEVRRAGQLKLRAQLAPGSVLRLMWLGNDRSYKEFDQAWRFTPDGRYSRYSRNQLISLKLDQVLSNELFFDFAISHSLSQYHHRLYDDIMDPRYVSDEWNSAENGFYYYDLDGTDYFTPGYTENAVYIGYANMGGTQNEHFSRRTDTWAVKSNVTRQWGKRHLWKAGFEFKQHRLLYDQRTVSFNNFDIVEPQGANDNRYERDPWESAVYVQDKIEFSDVTVNGGLRFDIFDAAADMPTNLRNPANSVREAVEPKMQISPRLAIAYLVSEGGVLHFSYGQFFQRPSFEVLYRNPDFEITGTNTIVGNPDLDVERTTQYEIGLQQQLSEDLAMNLSFYSRDIRDLVSTDRQIETVNVDKYYIFNNRDFGTVKGFVLSLDNRYTGNFTAGIDYTFQVAEANASSAEAARNALEGGGEVNKYLIPMDWDRRHTLNGYASYDQGGSWGLSLLGTYGSGLPYTPDPQSDDLVVGLLDNSGRKPEYVNFDLSGYWNVLANPNLQFTFQVKNLLDRRNENNVHAATGRAGYNIDWQDTQAEWYVDPGYWSRPREVIVGFRLSM